MDSTDTTPTPQATDANARQHGGTHYRASLQHWDFVAAAGLGYFEAQITRYLSRHRKKNGLLDVEKAEHYLEKLRELHAEGYPPRATPAWLMIEFMRRAFHRLTGQVPRQLEDQSGVLFQMFMEAQKPRAGIDEHRAMFLVTFWQEDRHLREALEAVRAIKAEYAAADAGRAYNAQSLDPPATATVSADQARSMDDAAEYAAQHREETK